MHLNLRPLAAPAGAIVGGLLGGPAGAAIGAGLFKTGDNLAHGDSVVHSLEQGALNGGLTAVGGAGLSKLRGAFGGGGAAASVADSAGAFTPSSAVDTGAGTAGGYLSQAPVNAADAAGGGSSLLSGIGSGARSAGSFIANHPQALGMGLQGIGSIAQSGTENALRKAQTNALTLNNQTDQYALDAKKKRDAALAPLLAAFQGRAQSAASNPYPIAPNPYTGTSTFQPYSTTPPYA